MIYSTKIMVNNEKLIIGKPYEIVVKENGRIIKVKGSELTEDDVIEMIEAGIINKEDVDFGEDAKIMLPTFDEIVAAINSKFIGWYGFFKKLYKNYPSIAFSLALREYAIAARKNVNIKIGDKVYIVNLVNFNVTDVIVPNNAAFIQGLDSIAYFPTEESAKQAVNAVLTGLSEYEK